MEKFRNLAIGALAFAMIGVMGVALPRSAQAEAIAYSSLDITNLIVTNLDTGETLTASGDPDDDADILLVGDNNNTSDINAGLVGSTETDSLTTPIESGGLDYIGNSTGDAMTDGFVCVGDCGTTTDNVFAQIADPAGTFSTADALLTGSVVDIYIAGVLVTTTGANSDTQAASQLQSTQEGSAESNTGTVVEFEIALDEDTNLQFDFTAAIEEYVKVGAEGGSADADASFSIQITDENNDVVFFWAPDGVVLTQAQYDALVGLLGIDAVNALGIYGPELVDDADLTQSIAINSTDEITVSESGDFSIQTFLAAGNYTFSIIQDVGVNTTLVIPEPSTLAIIGFGLIGFVALRRRSRRKVA